MLTESEKITEIIPALICARKAVKPAVKREDSHYGKYVDLAEVIACSLDALLDNDLYLSQPTIRVDEIDFVKTQISHISGQFICSYTKIINGRPNDPQAQGSAITYARRYGYEALLNIQRADDDGEGAMPKDDASSSQDTTSNPASIAKPANGVKKVSKAQVGLLGARFGKAGFSEDQRRAWLLKHYNTEHRKELPASAVNEIIKIFDAGMLSPMDLQDDIPIT